MAIFALNAHRAALLASCITIGLEGADQNHVDTGGENTTEDLQAITALLAELDAIAGSGGSAEVTVMRTEPERPAFTHPRQALQHHVTGAIERGEAEAICERTAGTQGVITDEIDMQIEGKLADGRYLP